MNENEIDEQNFKERDFQCYTGWKVPTFLKFAWFGLLIWIISYMVKYLWPSIMEWQR